MNRAADACAELRAEIERFEAAIQRGALRNFSRKQLERKFREIVSGMVKGLAGMEAALRDADDPDDDEDLRI